MTSGLLYGDVDRTVSCSCTPPTGGPTPPDFPCPPGYLPPSTAWATRAQTLSVLGSSNGSSWTTLIASASYTFNPATGNTVTINVPSSSAAYLRLNFTANSGWPAGQVSEFEIFAGTGGASDAPLWAA